MQIVAADINASFCVTLGDNFYLDGVENVADMRFTDTFENVFVGNSLQSEHFFRIIAGNHDHNGNVLAQFEYSEVSPRWSFPDYFYSFIETTNNGAFTVEFIMLDTIILSGNSDTGQLLGPTTPHHSLLRDKQLDFLAATLAASTADHIIVSGHYPVYSICEHGPTDLLISDVQPLLTQYNVAAYFAGHDHCAQHLEVGAVAHHGIGSAAFNDASTEHIDDVPVGSLLWHKGEDEVGGFASVKVNEDSGELFVSHHSGNGTLFYTAASIKPFKRALF